MMSFIVKPASAPLAGQVTVPGDKSIGHRALLFGALASGDNRVRGLSDGADNAATLAAIRALGVVVDEHDDELIIHGVGPDGLEPAAAVIDCGNSGTSMRLLCGLLAGQRFGSSLSGDASLRRRPMRRVVDPLAAMGAQVSGAAGAVADELYPPLVVAGRGQGTISAIDYRLPIASAQVKSALILAALYGDGCTRIVEPGRSRNHTEIMLAHMGAPVVACGGGVIEVDPRAWDRQLEGADVVVPGDPSSAAFLVVAGLIAGAEVRIDNVGVNPTRTGFLDVVAAMSAVVERSAREGDGGEPTADLRVAGAGDGLRAAIIAGDLTVRSIDEVPILAVLAARAEGDTEFRDAAELRVKESDRIATTCAMLRSLGVTVDERPDGFTVTGSQRPLSGGRINARGDHRIAMAAAVAALTAADDVRIDDVANVATSFPSFVATLRALGADVTVVG